MPTVRNFLLILTSIFLIAGCATSNQVAREPNAVSKEAKITNRAPSNGPNACRYCVEFADVRSQIQAFPNLDSLTEFVPERERRVADWIEAWAPRCQALLSQTDLTTQELEGLALLMGAIDLRDRQHFLIERTFDQLSIKLPAIRAIFARLKSSSSDAQVLAEITAFNQGLESVESVFSEK